MKLTPDALPQLLIDSHRRLTGRDLLPVSDDPASRADALYRAPFVVLAHDTAADPVFIYANLAAQRRFAMRGDEILGMPSRFSAEPLAREERQRLLERVSTNGFIDDYRGVRIASNGQRFEISRATVWNLIDAEGRLHGQAACFADWIDL